MDSFLGFQTSLPVVFRGANRTHRLSPRTRHIRLEASISSSPKQSHNATRRTFLRTAIAAATLTLISPLQTVAYSSPYRPSLKGEPSLEDRLYERKAEEIKRTPSGLQYFDLTAGTGEEAVAGKTVVVNYTSRLRGLNGIKIQSSFDDPSAPPFSFTLGDPRVVPGVSEAVQGMKVGGFRRAVLPPSIAYASPDMLPSVTEFFARRRLLSVLETNRDATIVFDFELVRVK